MVTEGLARCKDYVEFSPLSPDHLAAVKPHPKTKEEAKKSRQERLLQIIFWLLACWSWRCRLRVHSRAGARQSCWKGEAQRNGSTGADATTGRRTNSLLASGPSRWKLERWGFDASRKAGLGYSKAGVQRSLCQSTEPDRRRRFGDRRQERPSIRVYCSRPIVPGLRVQRGRLGPPGPLRGNGKHGKVLGALRHAYA